MLKTQQLLSTSNQDIISRVLLFTAELCNFKLWSIKKGWYVSKKIFKMSSRQQAEPATMWRTERARDESVYFERI